MGKFKVGDRVIAGEGNGWVPAGTVGTVDENDYVPYVKWDDGTRLAVSEEKLSAVWQPKVGDRVTTNGNTRVNIEKHWNEIFRLGSGDIINGALVVTSVADHAGSNVGLSNKVGRNHFFMPAGTLQPAAPATLTIEAGKFYKTRDGRKVGPVRRDGEFREGHWYWSAPYVDGIHTANWCQSGSFYERGEYSLDLIAEWVDDPANDNAAPAKFKVGDRVRCVVADDCGLLTFGREYIVNSFDGDYVNAYWDNGKTGGMDKSRFVLVTTTQPTAIVALIEDGQPKPASRPYVHATEASARVEASRLASVHKGQQFGVYVLTTTSQEAAPTYAHEWQRLAVAGRKIDAIKQVRAENDFLSLRSAKLFVEDFLGRAA
jgi:hypothetical protein